MSDKVKFHIGDILTVTTGKMLSVPEFSPINPDGTQWPPRKMGPVD